MRENGSKAKMAKMPPLALMNALEWLEHRKLSRSCLFLEFAQADNLFFLLSISCACSSLRFRSAAANCDDSSPATAASALSCRWDPAEDSPEPFSDDATNEKMS
jgi:hypothetical protein